MRTIVASFAAVVAPVWHRHGAPNKTLNWSRIRAAGSLRSAPPSPGPVNLDVYGVGDEHPLTVAIVDESVPYEEDSSIYLLINGQEGVSTVGFADLRRSFTFAFSTAEAAGRFVSAARLP